MSAKNLDNHNRWRSKTIAFRVSPEENEQIEIAVRLSGLTKQDYITRRLLNRDIVVQGNPGFTRPCVTSSPPSWGSYGAWRPGAGWMMNCSPPSALSP